MRVDHAVVVVIGCAAIVATSPPPLPLVVQVDEKDVRFKDAPNLPAGAKIAVLEGDPSAHEMHFTIRLQVPAGFTLPAHTHPADERVTVLAGDITVTILASGVSRASTHTFGVGAFYVTPPGVPHTVSSMNGATLQLTGVGPWRVEPWVPPAPAPAR